MSRIQTQEILSPCFKPIWKIIQQFESSIWVPKGRYTDGGNTFWWFPKKDIMFLRSKQNLCRRMRPWFFTLMREHKLYAPINQKKNSILLIKDPYYKKAVFSHYYYILGFVNKIFVGTCFFSYYLSIYILSLISLGPPSQMYLLWLFTEKVCWPLL